VDLTEADVEVNFIERPDTGKLFHNSLHLQEWGPDYTVI
jgi:hypothetical protein